MCAVDCRNFREGGETNGTLQAKSNGGISYNLQNTVRTGMIVRRLTPMECERLQGYPDGWTDIGEWMDSKGKRHKDADSPGTRHWVTPSPFRFGTSWQSVSAHNIFALLRWAVYSTVSAAFRWCSSGTTARARHAGQARSRNFPSP